MEITIKALKCGDSSLIKGNTQQILIDCGSDIREMDEKVQNSLMLPLRKK